MSTLKTLLCGAVVLASASFATVTPASADTGVYIGSDGASVYVDSDGRRHYRHRYNDRGYYYNDRYRPVHRAWRARCHNRVAVDWHHGHRVRVVDRVCYDRYGRARVVDRDYYRIGY